MKQKWKSSYILAVLHIYFMNYKSIINGANELVLTIEKTMVEFMLCFPEM